MDTEYTKQADQFLSSFGIKFTIKVGWDVCPNWCGSRHYGVCSAKNHGNHYRVYLTRWHGVELSRISFDFWGSYNDKVKGVKPDAYTVLSCISSEITCPDNFEEFCSEFGYSYDNVQDYRKAHKTWKLCTGLATKLQGFFSTEEEREALSDIQ